MFKNDNQKYLTAAAAATLLIASGIYLSRKKAKPDQTIQSSS
jgi:hypothetical protein